MSKYTKIVATISDARCDVDFIKQLYESGMNVVRMNSAHLQEEGFQKIIDNVRAVSNKIAILMDTKGPEVRTTALSGDSNILFSTGDIVRITGKEGTLTGNGYIGVSYPRFAEDLSIGSHILIDDGELEFVVRKKENDDLLCESLNNGELGARKSVNVPGVRINLPSLTEKDIRNIHYAIKQNIDFIAHSFVRSKQDVLDIQAILDEYKSPIKIIAKIENQEGVDNIDDTEAAYGVMVARGDLNRSSQEKIPGIQARLIKKCIQAKKPVIVATQMLHSMIKNPRPTRAEVTDIANAIYQHTDALMLSGETAYGKYPVEAVATMARVAEEAENNKLTENNIRVVSTDDPDVTSFLAKQAVKTFNKLGTKAIVTDSYTGRTARYVAAFRGRYPVLAICYYERTIRLLALSYGVFPLYQERTRTSREYLFNGLNHLMEQHLINRDDLIAYLGGGFGEGKGTTFLEINRVGEVLITSTTIRYPTWKIPKHDARTGRIHIDPHRQGRRAARFLDRNTHLYHLRPRMVSGHLQGRILKNVLPHDPAAQNIGTRNLHRIFGLVLGRRTDRGRRNTHHRDRRRDRRFHPQLFDKLRYATGIKLIIGDASDIIPTLTDTYDIVFIDANKRDYLKYYELVLPKVRPEGFILADNTLWDGKVVTDPNSRDAQTIGIERFNDFIATDNRVEKIILPLRDGLTILWKKP